MGWACATIGETRNVNRILVGILSENVHARTKIRWRMILDGSYGNELEFYEDCVQL
jgi:hypothetical protein